MQYARSNPGENRLRLVNSLVVSPYLFSHSFITRSSLRSWILLSETVVSTGGTLYWMSPELLDPPRFGSDGRLTRESDCYALGMVIYEVS